MNENFFTVLSGIAIVIAMTIQYLRTGRVGRIEHETDSLKDVVKALQAQHADDLKERDLQFARQEGFINGLKEQILRYEAKREESLIERAQLKAQIEALTSDLAKNVQALAETQRLLGALQTQLETTQREKAELELTVKELNTFRVSLEENNQRLEVQNKYLRDNDLRMRRVIEESALDADMKKKLLGTNILGSDPDETPTPELPSETQKSVEPAPSEALGTHEVGTK